MKDVSLKLGAVAIAVLATTGLVAAASSAHFGGGHFGQKNEAVKGAVDAGDYQAFKAAVGDGKASSVTEEQFSKMTEAHKLMEEGKLEEAKQLIKDSGLKMPFRGRGHGMMRGHFDPEKRKAVEAAFEANDYNAWVAAVGADSRQAKEVTQEEFPQLVKAHGLMEESRNIRQSIGLGPQAK